MDFFVPYDQLGVANPGPWQNASPASGQRGSIVNALAFPAIQNEILNVQDAAGLTRSANDFTQLLQALKILTPKYAGGAAVNGGLAKDGSNNFLLSLISNLKADNRAAPVAADVLALGRAADGLMVSVSASALASYILSNIVQTGTFQQVVVSQTLYVRSDGNDANNGLANTAAGAFLTPNAAIQAGLKAFNFASGTLLIKLGIPGTYPAPSQIPRASGIITIEGDIANQGAYILTGSSGSNALVTASGFCILNGLTISSPSTSLHCFAVGTGAIVACNNVSLSNPNGTSGSTAFCVGGSLQFNTGCILSGNAAAACDSDSGGSISVNTSTGLAIAGNPTYSVATVVATTQSRFILQGGAYFSGSANGARYFAADYSKISTNGGGPNAIPGTSAGSTSNGLYS